LPKSTQLRQAELHCPPFPPRLYLLRLSDNLKWGRRGALGKTYRETELTSVLSLSMYLGRKLVEFFMQNGRRGRVSKLGSWRRFKEDGTLAGCEPLLPGLGGSYLRDSHEIYVSPAQQDPDFLLKQDLLICSSLGFTHYITQPVKMVSSKPVPKSQHNLSDWSRLPCAQSASPFVGTHIRTHLVALAFQWCLNPCVLLLGCHIL